MLSNKLQMGLTPTQAATTATETMSDEVHFVVSTAGLLSARSLVDCVDADDETCTGGVAAVDAYSRFMRRNSTVNISTLIVGKLDHESAFIQQHPLQWDTNRLVMNGLLKWRAFVARSWFLGAEEAEGRNMDGLQSEYWPLIISNVAVPSTNSWYHYNRGVYFDSETRLAVINIAPEIDVDHFHYSSIDSAKMMLDFINRKNQWEGCVPNNHVYDIYVNRTVKEDASGVCWIPVIMAEVVTTQGGMDDFLPDIAHYHNPPALFVDYGGSVTSIEPGDPTLVQKTWAISFRSGSKNYQQLTLQLTSDRSWIDKASFVVESISGPLPTAVRDEIYAEQIAQLRKYSDETIANDPIVGESNEFPVAKNNGIVRCEAGECEHGNLFTDAMRWHCEADFAFANSGAYHGMGWPAGPVRVSHLWGALPFANTLCSGVMSGVSIYKMMNFSVSSATFSGADTVAGGDLLQVSGLRVTYNTDLPPDGKIVGLEIWNATAGGYEEVQRLTMYKFAADSYNCLFNNPFNLFTGSYLTIPGEEPGLVGPALEQEVVANFLTHLGEPYIGEVQGRLVNDTTRSTPLNLVQTEDGCGPGTFWMVNYQSCFECPTTSGVVSMVEKLDFVGVSGDPTPHVQKAVLQNNEPFPVAVVLKSIPHFLYYAGHITGFDNQEWQTIGPGETISLDFASTAIDLEAGMATGDVTIGVSDGGTYPGCVGNDISFPIEVSVNPTSQMNFLGPARCVGWVLSSFACLASLACAFFCFQYRNKRVIRTMQPVFLVTICVGVMILSLTIIPLSIDDGIVSEGWTSRSCMATPWLLSMGFTVAFSALFSKLWRINRLFESSAQMRRTKIESKDVVVPFAVLLFLNVATLTVWSFHDPLALKRPSVTNEPWNTYGVCRSSNQIRTLAYWLAIGFINGGALGLACWQAFRARNLSDEFSESTLIGLAIFSWVQISFVGIPVLFVIDDANTTARYIVQVGLLFVVCMSLLCWIFVPLIRQHYKYEKYSAENKHKKRTQVTITGLGTGVNTNLNSTYHKQTGGMRTYSVDSNDDGIGYHGYQKYCCGDGTTMISKQNAVADSDTSSTSLSRGGRALQKFSSKVSVASEDSSYELPSESARATSSKNIILSDIDENPDAILPDLNDMDCNEPVLPDINDDFEDPTVEIESLPTSSAHSVVLPDIEPDFEHDETSLDSTPAPRTTPLSTIWSDINEDSDHSE